MVQGRMTQDSGDKDSNKSDAIEDAKAATESSSRKPQSKRKVSKTLVEVDHPSFDHQRLREEPKETKVESVPKRRVARTLLDLGVHAFDTKLTQEQSATTAPPETEKPESEVDSKSRVSRTLLDADATWLDSLQGEQVETEGQELLAELATTAQPKDAERIQRFVAKTMLDSDVLATALQKFQVRKVELAAEEAKIRANQPGVEFHPVDSKKLVQRCPWRWNDDSTTRFRYCETCKLQVYNFDGLELPQAEALILIRENKSDATLYKRADGKFMTQDCPVQVKRRRTIALLSVVAVAMIVVLVATLILMPPKLRSVRTIGGTQFEATETQPLNDLSESDKNAQAVTPYATVHTGTRRRPTFTPKDESMYWE